MKKIGIFGGTFNPIHIAHLIIANYFVENLTLDKCIFIPANLSPHKIDAVDIASSESRLEMLKLAINDYPFFEIDLFEINKKGISYTFETIEYLKQKYSDSELFFLIGSDQAVKFNQWKNWQWICKNVQLVIAQRLLEKSGDISYLQELCSPIYLNNPIIEISSNEIRNRVKTGKSITFLVPKEVEEYIIRMKLYR